MSIKTEIEFIEFMKYVNNERSALLRATASLERAQLDVEVMEGNFYVDDFFFDAANVEHLFFVSELRDAIERKMGWRTEHFNGYAWSCEVPALCDMEQAISDFIQDQKEQWEVNKEIENEH